MAQQTAVEWLVDQLFDATYSYDYQRESIERAIQIERQRAIEFHRWMLKNDTESKAEQYFGYSDEDMYNAFLNK